MNVAIAVLVICFASYAPALADDARQALSITVQGDSAKATSLPAYDPTLPITVSVTKPGSGQPIEAVTIAASGPAGETVRVPLMSTGAARPFTGTLVLAEAGTWQLRLISHVDKSTTETTPISVSVVAAPPSTAEPIGWAVGGTIFIVLGGSGFFLLQRALSRPNVANLKPAA